MADVTLNGLTKKGTTFDRSQDLKFVKLTARNTGIQTAKIRSIEIFLFKV